MPRLGRGGGGLCRAGHRAWAGRRWCGMAYFRFLPAGASSGWTVLLRGGRGKLFAPLRLPAQKVLTPALLGSSSPAPALLPEALASRSRMVLLLAGLGPGSRPPLLPAGGRVVAARPGLSPGSLHSL